MFFDVLGQVGGAEGFLVKNHGSSFLVDNFCDAKKFGVELIKMVVY
jgi:hypothetical protein